VIRQKVIDNNNEKDLTFFKGFLILIIQYILIIPLIKFVVKTYLRSQNNKINRDIRMSKFYSDLLKDHDGKLHALWSNILMSRSFQETLLYQSTCYPQI
jgi:hypothetical protein